MPEEKEPEVTTLGNTKPTPPEDDKIVRKPGTKATDPAKDEDDPSGDLKPLGNTKP
ncbi:hypothetical protein [Streptomyces sp. WAC 06738]|uniref:hypothetical protein n=1 Tax=Streptomyces sp. WAC 06738 TaxID=2203210 RepID=UPI0013E0E0B1|nr:hypothetical protein [Streptomyces sp. WAC 06738]